MNMNQRVKITDPSGLQKTLHPIANLQNEKGVVCSIHKNINGTLCYVKMDTYPMTLPFYDYELEEI